MGGEPNVGLTCNECGGTPEACICEDLERVLSETPDAPDTPYGSDWGAHLKQIVRESNDGREAGASD